MKNMKDYWGFFLKNFNKGSQIGQLFIEELQKDGIQIEAKSKAIRKAKSVGYRLCKRDWRRQQFFQNARDDYEKLLERYIMK